MKSIILLCFIKFFNLVWSVSMTQSPGIRLASSPLLSSNVTVDRSPKSDPSTKRAGMSGI